MTVPPTARQLMQALAHLKLHDVVHRDVKLDNILLAAPGTKDEAAFLTVKTNLSRTHLSKRQSHRRL